MIRRKKRLRALLVCLLLPFGVQSQQDAAVAVLRRLEPELSEALVERDAVALERLWHDDLTFIGTNGRQLTKAERLSGQRSGEGRRDGEPVSRVARMDARGRRVAATRGAGGGAARLTHVC